MLKTDIKATILLAEEIQIVLHVIHSLIVNCKPNFSLPGSGSPEDLKSLLATAQVATS